MSGLNQGVYKAAFNCVALGENPFLRLFQILEADVIMVPNIRMGKQAQGSVILQAVQEPEKTHVEQGLKA